ncbi:hypothetical protein HZS_6460 [Henneguya salminicola]|nr:hypothetical protein HZS_6460 [Henneguya salminicola]
MAQNFAFSFGIGMLPFGLFTTFFYPRGRNQSNTNNHNLQQEEEDLSFRYFCLYFDRHVLN